ncbi:MAG: LUD domain-containing protein, partial [Proteobacteria bacterium]|nr:LUD domain-containing protein [Pseudomonadota bacterium]
TFIDPDNPDSAFDAEVGITGARLAVAETGSLALDSGSVQRRMASLAVSVHIAILRTDQIVADLVDWAEAIGNAPPALFRWRGRAHRVARAEGPERLAAEWWRECDARDFRDYYRVEDEDGGRYWLYRHGPFDARGAARWYLHGIFA